MARAFAGVFGVALCLTGCPQPEDPLAAATSQDGTATPGDPGNPPQAPDGTTPPPAPTDGSAPAPGEAFKPVGFASLIVDGKSVVIHGKLVGAKTAQVDFTAIKEVEGSATPEVIEIVNVTDGTFTVTAPATYEREIYVSAVAVKGTAGPTPDDPGGAAKDPIKLAGQDVNVEITLSTDPDWMKKLPWYREGAPTPPDPSALEGGGAGNPAVPPPPGASTDAGAAAAPGALEAPAGAAGAPAAPAPGAPAAAAAPTTPPK